MMRYGELQSEAINDCRCFQKFDLAERWGLKP